MFAWFSRQSLTVKLALGVVAFALILVLWLYGVRAWNGVGNWFYHHSENSAKAEIQELKTQVATETKIATQAVADYEASKQVYLEERKKRVLAETILADKTKSTDQKLAIYEAAVNAVPTSTGPESDAELCKRAKSLGIAVRCD